MGMFASLKNILQLKQDRRRSSGTSNSKQSNTSYMVGTTSLTNSSISSPTTSSKQANSDAGGYNYKYSDGRRYQGHDNVSYLLPNDDDENDRIHQQHWILRYAFQCNFHAPVTKMLEEGITVLDSGCGPATWTFEIGESYPRSKIYGVDASCVFPEDIKPANVEFAIGNIAKRIPYEDSMFDYVHQRLLIGGLTHDDWKNALKEHFRILKPGGYIELVEVGMTDLYKAGPLMSTLQSTFRAVMEARGLQFDVALQLKDRLQEAGFENIVVKKLPIPFNHGGKIGQLIWEDYRHLCMNVKPFMMKMNPLFEKEGAVEAHLDLCAEEVKQNNTYVDWYAAFAQKPMSDATKDV